MIQIEVFTFNPFQENTYLLFDETNEAIVVDPGMYDRVEEATLFNTIKRHGLQLKAVVNTHAHIDHVFGVAACVEKFGVPFYLHKSDLPTMSGSVKAAAMYGLDLQPVPSPTHWLKEGELVKFGNTELEIRFCPGHAPGHVVLVSHFQQIVIGGDVLFKESVGRVDLPGGDGPELDRSIRSQLYTLEDTYQVYPGHGPSTTIGYEKKHNSFVSETESRLLESE